jgi:alpha-amylase/alpha-mannosidase (GH57 family)
MPNGKPGDHPLTDIFVHKLETYGREADELILKIGRLCTQRELDEWWEREIGWSDDPILALRKARARYKELLKRAQEGGWETDT